jgi:hypothetical protein
MAEGWHRLYDLHNVFTMIIPIKMERLSMERRTIYLPNVPISCLRWVRLAIRWNRSSGQLDLLSRKILTGHTKFLITLFLRSWPRRSVRTKWPIHTRLAAVCFFDSSFRRISCTFRQKAPFWPYNHVTRSLMWRLLLGNTLTSWSVWQEQLLSALRLLKGAWRSCDKHAKDLPDDCVLAPSIFARDLTKN